MSDDRTIGPTRLDDQFAEQFLIVNFACSLTVEWIYFYVDSKR